MPRIELPREWWSHVEVEYEHVPPVFSHMLRQLFEAAESGSVDLKKVDFENMADELVRAVDSFAQTRLVLQSWESVFRFARR